MKWETYLIHHIWQKAALVVSLVMNKIYQIVKKIKTEFWKNMQIVQFLAFFYNRQFIKPVHVNNI